MLAPQDWGTLRRVRALRAVRRRLSLRWVLSHCSIYPSVYGTSLVSYLGGNKVFIYSVIDWAFGYFLSVGISVSAVDWKGKQSLISSYYVSRWISVSYRLLTSFSNYSFWFFNWPGFDVWKANFCLITVRGSSLTGGAILRYLRGRWKLLRFGKTSDLILFMEVKVTSLFPKNFSVVLKKSKLTIS